MRLRGCDSCSQLMHGSMHDSQGDIVLGLSEPLVELSRL